MPSHFLTLSGYAFYSRIKNKKDREMNKIMKITLALSAILMMNACIENGDRIYDDSLKSEIHVENLTKAQVPGDANAIFLMFCLTKERVGRNG